MKRMKAALLCAGPSLAKTWKTEEYGDYDVVIAVNHAMTHEPKAHWWCCGDWEGFKIINGSPVVGLCSIRDALRVAPSIFPPERWKDNWQLIAWEDLPLRSGKSMLSAMGLAIYLGASDVTIFGDDKKGNADCAGYEDNDRGEHRWSFERKEMDSLIIQALKDFGVLFMHVEELR